MKALVVTSPFGADLFSEMITDPDTIAKIIVSEHAGHVVMTNLPEPAIGAPDKSEQA